jgi:hypothetical protein
MGCGGRCVGWHRRHEEPFRGSIVRNFDRMWAKIQLHKAASCREPDMLTAHKTRALIDLLGAWPRSVVSPVYGRGRLPVSVCKHSVVAERGESLDPLQVMDLLNRSENALAELCAKRSALSASLGRVPVNPAA